MRNLPEIADDLDRIADRIGSPGRPFKNLAVVLAGSNARALRQVDLASAFGPEQLLPDRESVGTALVGFVRDVATFGPPVYVASRLIEALHAWGGRGPFLAGWQQGFGHAVPTLGETCAVTALTVAAAVALSVAVRLVRDLRDARAQHRRVRISRLISEATLALAVPAGHAARLAQAATTLKASLQSTTDYFAGLTAAAGGGARPGLHRTSARLIHRLGLIADEIVDAVAAGQDATDRLAEFQETADQLSRLLRRNEDDKSDNGSGTAAARFAAVVRDVVSDSQGGDVVPSAHADLEFRGEAR